jgi:hypothetical protein
MDSSLGEEYDPNDPNDPNDYIYYNYSSSDTGVSDEFGYMLIFLVICGSWTPCLKLVNSCLTNCRQSRRNKRALKIKTVNSNDEENLLNECPICLEQYAKDEKICILQCDHTFHEKCIKEWLKNSENCPNCRENII